ncbi:hypothetical protein C2S52_008201 [Perilla frutescens var. hirtella]|nr:hypothetical protein C2S52_008201 [Perilla frutescens var. hirtella]
MEGAKERQPSWKDCLGALDDTYIPVKVLQSDKARYKNRKGNVTVNMLVVCDQNMNYVYVLTGCEGSVADSRVLRDAISRSNGLKVPIGNYYLCDGGYTNVNGFLAPYEGVRYHLQEWDSASLVPTNPHEYFNLKHAKARYVIERSFGLLNGRWAILRSTSFYPIKVQNRIIMACCLLHNFIRTYMPYDPLESTIPEDWTDTASHVQMDKDFIDQKQLKMSGRTRITGAENKSEKTRRTWTLREEHKLIIALKEVVARGWKCDNGFRTSYLGVLEQLMQQAIPGNDLKVEPHIISKIHVWKKKIMDLYPRCFLGVVLVGMKAHTLLKWTMMKYGLTMLRLIAMQEQCDISHDPYIKIGVKYLEKIEQLLNMLKPLLMLCKICCTRMKRACTPQLRMIMSNLLHRIKMMKLEMILCACLVKELVQVQRMDELVQRIGFEHDASMSRKKVYEALDNMSHLSDEEQIYVAKYLCNNTKDLDLLFSLPDEKRVVMVRMIISGKI